MDLRRAGPVPELPANTEVRPGVFAVEEKLLKDPFVMNSPLLEMFLACSREWTML